LQNSNRIGGILQNSNRIGRVLHEWNLEEET